MASGAVCETSRHTDREDHDPAGEADHRRRLSYAVAACHKYLNVQAGIVFFAAGPICRELDRPVNDRDWDVGLHLVCDTKASHDAYQDDATHNKFIDENKPTWAGVRVFDSYV